MKRCSDGMQNKGGQKMKVNIQGTIPTSEFLSGVRVGGGGDGKWTWLAPPWIENSIYM